MEIEFFFWFFKGKNSKAKFPDKHKSGIANLTRKLKPKNQNLNNNVGFYSVGRNLDVGL